MTDEFDPDDIKEAQTAAASNKFHPDDIHDAENHPYLKMIAPTLGAVAGGMLAPEAEPFSSSAGAGLGEGVNSLVAGEGWKKAGEHMAETAASNYLLHGPTKILGKAAGQALEDVGSTVGKIPLPGDTTLGKLAGAGYDALKTKARNATAGVASFLTGVDKDATRRMLQFPEAVMHPQPADVHSPEDYNKVAQEAGGNWTTQNKAMEPKPAPLPEVPPDPTAPQLTPPEHYNAVAQAARRKYIEGNKATNDAMTAARTSLPPNQMVPTEEIQGMVERMAQSGKPNEAGFGQLTPEQYATLKRIAGPGLTSGGTPAQPASSLVDASGQPLRPATPAVPGKAELPMEDLQKLYDWAKPSKSSYSTNPAANQSSVDDATLKQLRGMISQTFKDNNDPYKAAAEAFASNSADKPVMKPLGTKVGANPWMAKATNPENIELNTVAKKYVPEQVEQYSRLSAADQAAQDAHKAAIAEQRAAMVKRSETEAANKAALDAHNASPDVVTMKPLEDPNKAAGFMQGLSKPEAIEQRGTAAKYIPEELKQHLAMTAADEAETARAGADLAANKAFSPWSLGMTRHLVRPALGASAGALGVYDASQGRYGRAGLELSAAALTNPWLAKQGLYRLGKGIPNLVTPAITGAGASGIQQSINGLPGQGGSQ